MNNIAKEVLKKINDSGNSAYIVGGYVRDFILRKTSTDIDICTSAKVKDLLTIFKGKVNDYGSLNMKIKEFNIDITTFREEGNYYKRRPTDIIYISNLRKDLERRDFTINTICMDQNSRIIDYLNGLDDLKNGIIRSVGNPIVMLKDDPLRIFRAIRFATVLDFIIEDELDIAIIEYAKLVKTLSAYRIKDEISKILLSPNYKKGLNLLKKYKIDEYLNLNFKNLVYTSDLCGMWAQMENIDYFPFTKNEKNTIVKLREILNYGFINNEIIYKYGLYLSLVAGEILGLEPDFIHELYQNMPIYFRKDLKISYLEIAEIVDMKPSKKVKDIEAILIQEVLKERVDNSYDSIKKYLLNNKERWIKNE